MDQGSSYPLGRNEDRLAPWLYLTVDWDTSSDDDDDPDWVPPNSWDTPQFVAVPVAEISDDEGLDEELVSDWLSDRYGWCVNGWSAFEHGFLLETRLPAGDWEQAAMLGDVQQAKRLGEFLIEGDPERWRVFEIKDGRAARDPVIESL